MNLVHNSGIVLRLHLNSQVTATVQDMTEHVHQPTEGPSGSPGGPSAAQGRWMGLRIGFMRRLSSKSAPGTPSGPAAQPSPAVRAVLSAQQVTAVKAEHNRGGPDESSERVTSDDVTRSAGEARQDGREGNDSNAAVVE